MYVNLDDDRDVTACQLTPANFTYTNTHIHTYRGRVLDPDSVLAHTPANF
jgi:hypothetical protein